jgi:hypothetical protein
VALLNHGFWIKLSDGKGETENARTSGAIKANPRKYRPVTTSWIILFMATPSFILLIV